MRLALYGGSFDPPHIAHLEIIKEVLDSCALDLLVVMIAYQNPLKPSYRFDEKLRLRWMEKICSNYQRVVVSDYEIRNKINYTIDTIEYLKKYYQPESIDVILGEDNFLNLDKWHEIEQLKKKVNFILVKRIGFEYNMRDFPIKTINLKNITFPVSSTQIREYNRDCVKFVPAVILDEVLQNLRS
ncbi:nicotinate (nicotinamide) nucleotide adenylyltransferase [Helicobacter anatolicus]|nr:nicotinate (nicotinamide) nucleotide adenylyltransferase [Helicobacter anatolicus]MCE3037565.1 nicotinate (nicotinamide) nucleotide adenylyltransferase [Helicobacter anatolicus]MCE3039980.1 nicotinate (nicotinamide) nucleotide adenylyltransferase [Helicobacter anatolicus]